MGLSGVEVAPFGPKLCRNVAPRLRIIFQALPGPKTQLKNIKKMEMLKIPLGLSLASAGEAKTARYA